MFSLQITGPYKVYETHNVSILILPFEVLSDFKYSILKHYFVLGAPIHQILQHTSEAQHKFIYYSHVEGFAIFFFQNKY